MKNIFTSLVLCMLVAVCQGRSPFAPPAPSNDECANAQVLTVGSNSCPGATSGTTHFATLSATLPLPYCAPDGINDDVWYKFTAPSGGVLNLDVTTTNPDSELSANLYRGTCGNLEVIDCNYGSAHREFFVTKDSVYYVRVFSSSPDDTVYNDFTICTSMTNNDECASARVLPIGPGYCMESTIGTTFEATQSSTLPAPSCGGLGYNDDVWYKITTTTSGRIYVKMDYSDGIGGSSMQVYSGTCNTLTAIACNSADQYNPNVLAFDALADTSYYVRVFSTSIDALDYFNFSICTYSVEAPYNDNCNQPYGILLGKYSCQGTYYGNTAGATTSGTLPAPTCQATGADDDIWFNMFADSAGMVRVKYTSQFFGSNTSGTVLQIYVGDCPTLAPIACETFASDGFMDIPVMANRLYTIRAFTQESSIANFSDFSLCAFYLPPQPPNDTCDNAVALVPSPSDACATSEHGTTLGATPSLPGCNGGVADDEVWYMFTATATSHNITVTPSVTSGVNDVQFELFSGTCASLQSEHCVNSTNGNDAESEIINNLFIGDTYFLRVYSHSMDADAQGEFDICITTPTVVSPVCIPNNPNDGSYNITNVTINGIGNVTNTNPANGYNVFPITFPGQQAMLAQFGVTTMNRFTYTRIWIDYNDNDSFEDANELVFAQKRNGLLVVNGTFVIPPDAPVGIHRLRIRTNGNSAYTSCEAGSLGETEDYTINIANGDACGGQPIVSIAYASGYVVCTSGNSVELMAYANGLGIQFQWQQSSSPTTGFTNISGATGYMYTTDIITTNTYFRCVMTCPNSGQSVTSAVQSISISGVPANDDICNAIALVTNVPNCQNTTCATAVNDPGPSEYTASTPNNTVWYKYTPTVTSPVTLKVKKQPGDLYPLDSWLTFYTVSGTCGAYTFAHAGSLQNPYRANLPADDSAVILSPALNAGTTYYIMLDGYTGSYGAFCITLVPNTVTWLGIISSEWENPQNWSTGSIPNAASEVIINASPHDPILSSNATITSLKINGPPASMTVKTSFKLTVSQ